MRRHDSRAPSAEALGADGPFALRDPAFVPRQVQQRMAAAVEDAIAERRQLVVEAGTGTGKTFAYLVPLLLSGKRAIVSTGTKNLQDQLYDRDLPRVLSALKLGAKTALLKGRANYLCLHRLDQTVREGRLASRDDVAALAQIRRWRTATDRGDIGELASVPEGATIWPKVTAQAEQCLGRECAFWNDCFVVRARREAQDADVVVVNHHLLFADLAIKREGFGEILPGAEVFVLDEAHQVPELAGQFFSTTVSARQLIELEQDGLREAAAVPGALSTLTPLNKRLDTRCKQLRLSLAPFGPRAAWPPVRERPEIKADLDDLRDELEQLGMALGQLAETSEGLTQCQARAEEYLRRVDLLLDAQSRDDVQWFELTERGFNLTSTPLDVAAPLEEFRRQTHAAWIYTSATLAVGETFEHFQRQMGLQSPETLRLDSPFDYARCALLYLPAALPRPNDPAFTDRVIAAVRPVLTASRGRAFLLFTSHRALRRAAELLSDLPFPLFVQGTAPRAVLLERFRKSGDGVLLGAASFWEGVDVVGEALSVVVIDKLPFAAPDDPVLAARLRAIEDDGGSPFFEHQVPQAAIALKQGAGRLIRSIHDRGVLMVCDIRLTAAGYGRIFLDSLPPMRRTRDLGEVEAFFAFGPDSP